MNTASAKLLVGERRGGSETEPEPELDRFPQVVHATDVTAHEASPAPELQCQLPGVLGTNAIGDIDRLGDPHERLGWPAVSQHVGRHLFVRPGELRPWRPALE